jgi:hypothetical protein
MSQTKRKLTIGFRQWHSYTIFGAKPTSLSRRGRYRPMRARCSARRSHANPLDDRAGDFMQPLTGGQNRQRQRRHSCKVCNPTEIGRNVAYLSLMQWPAMIVTIVASWLVASQSKAKRAAGFWAFLLSNALWIVWGLHDHAYALIILQFALASLNIRGASKNESAETR